MPALPQIDEDLREQPLVAISHWLCDGGTLPGALADDLAFDFLRGVCRGVADSFLAGAMVEAARWLEGVNYADVRPFSDTSKSESLQRAYAPLTYPRPLAPSLMEKPQLT
jgi:hypothetical protein